jgi:hypothetical protein
MVEPLLNQQDSSKTREYNEFHFHKEWEKKTVSYTKKNIFNSGSFPTKFAQGIATTPS